MTCPAEVVAPGLAAILPASLLPLLLPLLLLLLLVAGALPPLLALAEVLLVSGADVGANEAAVVALLSSSGVLRGASSVLQMRQNKCLL